MTVLALICLLALGVSGIAKQSAYAVFVPHLMYPWSTQLTASQAPIDERYPTKLALQVESRSMDLHCSKLVDWERVCADVVLLHDFPQSCMPNPVEGLHEVYEDLVEVLLVMEIFLREDS